MALQVLLLAFSWFGSRVNGYVVHVDCYVTLVNKVSEDCVHHRLKGGRQVSEAEEHDGRFIEPFVGDKCHLPSVFWLNEYFVVSPLNVNTGELHAVS